MDLSQRCCIGLGGTFTGLEPLPPLMDFSISEAIPTQNQLTENEFELFNKNINNSNNPLFDIDHLYTDLF